MKETELSNNEKQFVLSSLHDNLRLDGRNFQEKRKLDFKLLGDYGHCLVTLGNTKAMAKVSAEITRPIVGKPTEGVLFFNTEFSPMASPSFDLSQPTDEQILVGRLLDRIFRKSKAVDTEGLCIVAGEHVWTVRVDIHFLDHDGNLLDAACLAASIALSHFRRPFVSLDENEQVVLHSIYEKNPVPLAIHFIPISTTFSIFDNGIVLVDCTSIEEKIQLGQLTITMNRQRELVAVSKAGGAMISVNTYLQCQQLAVAEMDELIDRIELFIKSDLESRRKIK